MPVFSNRYPSIDYLRVLLAGCVVFVHVVLMTDYQFRGMTEIGYGVLRLVVPAFALLSGFGLYHTASRGRLAAWLRGLVMLYLVWTLIYAPVWLREVQDWQDLLLQVVNGPMHLWYVACLVQAVAVLWFLRRLAGPGREMGAVAAAGIASAVLATAAQYNTYYGMVAGISMNRASIFYLLPFVVQGYLAAHWIARRGRDSLPPSGLLWALVVIILVLRVAEVMWLDGRGATLLKDPPEFPLLLYVAPVMIVLAVIRVDLPAVRMNLSSASVIIYLMHMGIIIACVTVGLTQMWTVLALSILVPILAAAALPRLPVIGVLGRNASASGLRR